MLTPEIARYLQKRQAALQSWRAKCRSGEWLESWHSFVAMHPERYYKRPRAICPDLSSVPRLLHRCSPELLHLLVLFYPRRVIARHFRISVRTTYRKIPSNAFTEKRGTRFRQKKR